MILLQICSRFAKHDDPNTQRYETSQDVFGGQNHLQEAFGLFLLPRCLSDPCLNLAPICWFLLKTRRDFLFWRGIPLPTDHQ